MEMDASRLKEMSRLLDVLEVHVGIVSRRLMKSGPGHYARARFDALAFIVRTQLVDLDVEEVTEDSPTPILEQLTRLLEIHQALQEMAVDYKELDPVYFARNDKNRHRSERLIDEILESSGLRRRGVDLEVSIYEGRAAAQYRSGHSPEDDEDAPVILNGFDDGKKRGGR